MPAPFDTFDLASDEVHARFEWALRQGRPRWLWPEVSIAHWNAALEDIERVTRGVLTSGHSSEVLGDDPLALGIAAYTSGMGPLLGHWLREGRFDATRQATAILLLHFEHNSRRMAQMRRRAAEAIGMLGRNGVRVTVLKGMHTAWEYFPVPGARPLSDIDLLIDPAGAQRADGALTAMGLVPGISSPVPRQQTWRPAGSSPTPRSLSLVHCDDPWSIDLQASLNRRYSAGAPLVRLDAVHEPGAGPEWQFLPTARTLPQPLLSIQLACHAGCGLFSLSLIRLVEFVLVIRRDLSAGRFAWDEFVAMARQTGALGICWPALRLSEMLAPGAVPQDVLDLCERDTPRAVRRIVTPLTPASGHQVTRWSWAEHFMWAQTLTGKLRLILEDLLPPQAVATGSLLRTYRQRAWRLAHGTLARD